jgi:hypothetical protein
VEGWSQREKAIGANFKGRRSAASSHVTLASSFPVGVVELTDAMDTPTNEPLILRGSTPADREARAQHLANLFVGEMVPLLVQVRQDFLDKDRDELIYDCRTFTEYCTRVLRYSESHIRRLIAGQNPATKFDGSKNRLQIAADADQRTCVERAFDSGVAERTRKNDPVLFGLYLAQAYALDGGDISTAASLEGQITDHIVQKGEEKKMRKHGLVWEPENIDSERMLKIAQNTEARVTARFGKKTGRIMKEIVLHL